MDQSRLELEREIELDPSNLQLLERLDQVYKRIAWTFEGRTITEWITRLKTRGEIFDVLEVCEEIGPVVLPTVLRLMEDRELDFRDKILKIPGRLKSRAAAIAIPLQKFLTDHDKWVRWQCSWTLSYIKNPAVVPALLAALEAEQDSLCRETFVGALGRLAKPGDYKVLRSLRSYSRTPRLGLKRHCKEALEFIHQAPKKITLGDLLARYRAEDDQDKKDNLLWSIGKLGREAKSALPLLITQLSADSLWARKNACFALGRIAVQCNEILFPLSIFDGTRQDPVDHVEWAARAIYNRLSRHYRRLGQHS